MLRVNFQLNRRLCLDVSAADGSGRCRRRLSISAALGQHSLLASRSANIVPFPAVVMAEAEANEDDNDNDRDNDNNNDHDSDH